MSELTLPYSVADDERGRVVAFCPVCRAQVFGEETSEVSRDLLLHMNVFHPRSVQ